MYSAVLTRALNEPFLMTFIEHYLRQHVDHIYICVDRWTTHLDVLRKARAQQHVTIVPMVMRRALGKSWHAQRLYAALRKYRWIINVDADEYLLPCSGCLRDKLQSYHDVDAICIPWVTMGFHARDVNPVDLLRSTTLRLDHDRQRQPLPLLFDARFAKHKDGYFISAPKSIVNPKICTHWDEHAPWSWQSHLVRDSVLGLDCWWRGPCFKPWWMHAPNHPFFAVLRNGLGFDRQTWQWGAGESKFKHWAHAPPPGDGRAGWLSEASLAQADILCFHYRFTSSQGLRDKVTSASSSYAAPLRTASYHADLTVEEVDASEVPELRMACSSAASSTGLPSGHNRPSQSVAPSQPAPALM